MRHADFQLAAGSVMGRDHRHAFRNSQDSWIIVHDSCCTVAVVTDGCGSSPHSEVGAKIGAGIVAAAVQNLTGSYARSNWQSDFDWEWVSDMVTDSLEGLTYDLLGDTRQTVQDYLLFTIIGVLLAGRTAQFFALGDGVVIVNSESVILGPFPDNSPPYIGYNVAGYPENPLVIRPVLEISLTALDNFLIGTDGAVDFMRSADRPLPGLNELSGPVSQFWEDDRYFSGNPDLVSRRLRLAARDWPKRDPYPGLLSDDTTLIAGRRRPAS